MQPTTDLRTWSQLAQPTATVQQLVNVLKARLTLQHFAVLRSTLQHCAAPPSGAAAQGMEQAVQRLWLPLGKLVRRFGAEGAAELVKRCKQQRDPDTGTVLYLVEQAALGSTSQHIAAHRMEQADLAMSRDLPHVAASCNSQDGPSSAPAREGPA